MLYIGHFSFDEVGKNAEKRHGYFSCMVAADEVDKAVEAFKNVIQTAKAENEHFTGIVAVYIEDIFEIQKIPETPTMLLLQSSAGEFPESTSRSLPLGDNMDVTAYGLASDVQKIQAADKSAVMEMVPFLSFT